VLELREVRKHYLGRNGETIRAVDGVSLTIEPGELLTIYGPSGSGKSTLLMLAAGIAQPDAGTVAFDGRDLATFGRGEAARHRRSQLGFVFETFRLMPGLTAIDNAALKLVSSGMSRHLARRQVAPLIDRLGLAAQADRPAALLSRGERQRIAIARALANEPRLLLADEPTGSLDSRRSREVLELLAEVCRERGLAVALVTHDPAGADFADRSFELCDGRLGALTRPPR
jgi:putative ABC transport system ATP-binding protein